MGEKIITSLLCVFGISAVSYGMIKENHIIFMIGLLSVIGGYLLIRKRLKTSLREKS